MVQYCTSHPKYRGKKEPKNECEDCLALYMFFYRERGVGKRPQPPEKDKTKYLRRKKHKEKTDDQ